MESTIQDRFLDLAKQEEALEERLSDIRQQLGILMIELKEGTYIQDPTTMAVYKIVKPLGHFVHYKDLDYKHTALNGKKGGTFLSKKEAQEAGFILGE